MIEAKTEQAQTLATRYCEYCRLWLKPERFTNFGLACADCATADGAIVEWTRRDLLHTGRNARGERLVSMRRHVEGDGAHTVYPRPGWSIKFEIGGVRCWITGVERSDDARRIAQRMLDTLGDEVS